MASPVGHALIGVVIYELSIPREKLGSIENEWKPLLPFIIFPNLPDIDFLLGYLLYHDPHILHSGSTHTLAFAVLISLLVAPSRLFGRPFKTCTTTFILICSHLFLDMGSGKLLEGIKGVGVMLLYPFSKERIGFPLILFHGPRSRTVLDLFSMDNIRGALWELFVFSPIIFYFRATIGDVRTK